jgi:hypothetical protein
MSFHDIQHVFIWTEVVKLFSGQGVDGLGLLTLQRNHEACLGMSNSEWLLVKVSISLMS